VSDRTPDRDRSPRQPGRSGRVVASVVGAGLVLTGCASDAELDTLEPRGPSADMIDRLIGPVFITAGVIMVVLFGVIIYAIVKNRVVEYAGDEWPKQVHGNTRLELLWTAIPTVIMVVIAVASTVVLVDLNGTEANAYEVSVEGEPIMWEPTVVVVGQQWWWEYRYYFHDQVDLTELRADFDAKDLPPADIVTSGQMVIPVDHEIELIVTSRDVIHSFWIPALNGKRDAVPGHFNPWKLEASDPGVYFGQCTEFCGLSHSRMRMQVVAMEPADFQTWVDQTMAPAEAPTSAAAEYLAAYRAGEAAVAPTEQPAERGLATFVSTCSACHLIGGVNDHDYVEGDIAQVSGAAPDLTHLASRTTFAGGTHNLYNPDGSINRIDLEAWLRNPAALKAAAAAEQRGMPDLGLSEDTIDDLVAYLSTLGPAPSSDVIAATEVE
jgi:cytochrome c oxidase subunit 2